MKTLPSIETQKRMHAFFMKTSAPRLYQEFLERDDQTQTPDEWISMRRKQREYKLGEYQSKAK